MEFSFFFSWKRNAVVSLQAYLKGRFWFLDIEDHCQPQQVLLPLILRNECDGELREWRRYSAHLQMPRSLELWLSTDLLFQNPFFLAVNDEKKTSEIVL